MRVLFVTSEVFPLVKTGGLADVSAALPRALRRAAIDVRLLMPAYPQALAQVGPIRESLPLGDLLHCGETNLLATVLPETGVPVWLAHCPNLFDRPGNPYLDDGGSDWRDNHLRFALLCHVAATLANNPVARWRPDIIHANDWHTGLIPLLLASKGAQRPPVIFTVHNLAYQGLFDASTFDALKVPSTARRQLEYYGQLSFLKAGIQASDAVTTVSPTYAKEILSPEFGCGLDGVLRARSEPPIGIFNGIDHRLWNPESDPSLAAHYSADAMRGKVVCRREIRAEMGLDQIEGTPLVAFTSRLSHQKMPDVVLEALPTLLDMGLQFALVAQGDRDHEDRFRALASYYPGKVAVKIGYDEATAHRLLAGADMLLHPARFEPCGLVPLYAMRYGTVPVVRRCGGSRDSVIDLEDETAPVHTATGFAFDAPTVADMIGAMQRALAAFRQPLLWRRLSAAGMTRDFSWTAPARAYEQIYRSLTGVLEGNPTVGELDFRQIA